MLALIDSTASVIRRMPITAVNAIAVGTWSEIICRFQVLLSAPHAGNSVIIPVRTIRESVGSGGTVECT